MYNAQMINEGLNCNETPPLPPLWERGGEMIGKMIKDYV